MLDAAKAMRLFHESPELSLGELALPFLDARKRVAHYPEVEHTVRLLALPTTAGTGSEVSPATVISAGGRKVTLVDYSLVPDVAIVDPTLTLTMPPSVTADTGVDALTHALEAGVSIFASPYTDAFCMQAINLIMEALPGACADGSDLEVRTAMSQRGDDRRPRLLERLRRRQPRARARGRSALRDPARPRQRDLPAPRAALQRLDPLEVHAGAGLLDLRGPRQVRADGVGARARRAHAGGAARAAVREDRRAAGPGRHAQEPAGASDRPR